MVKKLESLSADSRTGAELPIAVKDSAQQIWLAGLGAFAKAQEEGGKVFEALVKEGARLQRKSQNDAEQRLTDATHRITTLATEISNKASGQWDKLENIFEERVSKALKRLSVPSAADIEALSERIETLTAEVRKLSAASGARAAAAKTGGGKTGSGKRGGGKSGASPSPASASDAPAPAARKRAAARKPQ